MAEIDHEALGRQLEGEPHFLLLARDEIAPGMVRLYAALRARHMHAINDIVRNLIVTAGKMPYHPTKDSEHGISSQQVANRMDIWRWDNMPKVPKNARSVELDFGGTADEPQP